jgi:outer membrane lipoprotein-sorting protein
MKSICVLFALVLGISFSTQAQTAEKIIESYLETIGGSDKLESVKTIMTEGKAQAQGMEIPITMYQKAHGKQRMDMVFQGQQITQMAFDGEQGWSVNFMTMEPEKWDAEQSQVMAAEMDFPDPFLNYKEKGYSLSLEGEEEVEGTGCFKVKLTKKPITIDGKEEENFQFHYFDKETNVPIMIESFAKSGPQKGQSVKTYMSDYQEVDGIYFPFSITQKMGDQAVWDMSVVSMELNTEIDDVLFAFPEKEATEEGK